MTLETKVPPPVVAVVAAAAIYAVHRLVPAAQFSNPARVPLVLLLAAISFCIVLLSVLSFHRHGTTTNPTAPSRASALVRSGVYRFTRNPMYLGLLIALTAWAVWLSNWLGFLVLPAFVAYITRYQIVSEERALAAKFGAEFNDYAAQVRRWI